MTLLISLQRLAALQQDLLDPLQLEDTVEAAQTRFGADARAQLTHISRLMQLKQPLWLSEPDPLRVPALIYVRQGQQLGQWGILRGKNAAEHWVSEWWDVLENRWQERLDGDWSDCDFACIRLTKPFVASQSPVFDLIRHAVFSDHGLLREIVIGGIVINLISVMTSFYSMQIYDRVVPTAAYQTLLVLTLGVVAAIVFELISKHLRTRNYELLVDHVDQRLARTVYQRFLSIRLDQLPQSVGSLAGQMRGYEVVRSFLTNLAASLLIDAPFALVFSVLILLIGGWLALIPLSFFIIACLVGYYYRRKIENLAATVNSASNFKTGLLVESIEGAETIKSGQAGWRMLSRWMQSTDESRHAELLMRQIAEHAQHLTATFQQLSYVLLVASGALNVSTGNLSMGALIACSILSGRIFGPVALIPGLLTQWAHAKAALQGLDLLWRLEDDHGNLAKPLLIESFAGKFLLENVVAQYGPNRALQVSRLLINPGDKIGVLGQVGSGKTTLLRLLSGMYKPREGRVLLDDIELNQISKPCLSAKIAYLQQDGRLFAGTLRENLILGLLDPGDETIIRVAKFTGLFKAVISQNPKGLQQDIYEGGSGLSGGQRQLLNMTRVFLRRPDIWLLDEPTASMDQGMEQQIISALSQSIKPSDTLVLVTHKSEMLQLVDRLLVIHDHQVVLDGPKDQVLQQLQSNAR